MGRETDAQWLARMQRKDGIVNELRKRYPTLSAARRALIVKVHWHLWYRPPREHLWDICLAFVEADEKLTLKEKQLLLKELKSDCWGLYENFKEGIIGDDPVL